MELVHVEIEVHPIGFRRIRPRQGGYLKLADEEGAEEVCLVFTEQTFGQVSDEYPAVVHDEARGDAVRDLAQDIAKRRGHEQAADLVLEGADDFGKETVVVA